MRRRVYTKGMLIMNLRKQRQKRKKRDALHEERMFGIVYNHQDPTARMAIGHIMRKSSKMNCR